MKFLIVIVVLLGVVAIAQAVRVNELAKELSKRKEEDINVADNDLNARLWIVALIVLLGSFFWMIFKYWDAMLPGAASEHGAAIDQLMEVNLWLVSVIFVIMNILLMWFASKYRYKVGKKAFYYPHNDTWEKIWTLVPAVVMAGIIIYGLSVWDDVTMSDEDKKEDRLIVELYAKQFDWAARYGGPNKGDVLGPSSFNFISGTNPLGVITADVYDATLADIESQMSTLREDLRLNEAEEKVMSETAAEEAQAKLERLQRHKVRVLGFNRENPDYALSADDIVMDQGIFYIPVDREVEFFINSRDVIHSAFMPHFRMQMNAVPGMTTTFRMTPTITTAEMKEKEGEDFEYMLLCNKICGAAHYNMKMTVKVVEQAEFDQWLSVQKTFVTADDGALTAKLESPVTK